MAVVRVNDDQKQREIKRDYCKSLIGFKCLVITTTTLVTTCTVNSRLCEIYIIRGSTQTQILHSWKPPPPAFPTNPFTRIASLTVTRIPHERNTTDPLLSQVA
ncbi:unnamed protein product [Sphacelaria rigidula]